MSLAPHRLLRLIDATKSFGETPVLERVNLDLTPGHTWVEGANGSGKSTLGRVLAGLSSLDAGEIRGADRRVVGYAAEGRGLAAGMTCEAQLRFTARQFRLPRRSVATALERFDLVGLRKQRCRSLSTGQRQRLRLALASLPQPDVLLLDEAHIGLDEAGIAAMTSLLEEVVGRDGAVISFGQWDDHLPQAVVRYRLDRGRLENVEASEDVGP